jgi:uncharacterized membrane protein YkvA (DUF1232 family)
MDSVLGLLNIHKTGRLFWRLMRDSRVSFLMKIYACAGLIYFFSPLDVIPHDFTGIGIIDDIIVGLVIMQAFIEMAPPQALAEHCERLEIDLDKVLLPAPVIVADAMDMFLGRREGRRDQVGAGWRAAREDRRPTADEESVPGREARQPPQYSKYSAFRED